MLNDQKWMNCFAEYTDCVVYEYYVIVLSNTVIMVAIAETIWVGPDNLGMPGGRRVRR